MEQYFRTRASVDDDPDLARTRRANDARLKSRFEHIFAKYGQDFDDIGDEIDLQTGKIVVNNGHLQNMRHEVDPGKGVSSQVLRVLEGGKKDTDKTGMSDDGFVVDSEEEEGSIAAGLSAFSNSDAIILEEGQRRRVTTHAHDELSSDFYPPEYSQNGLQNSDMDLREQDLDERNDELDNDESSYPPSRSKSPENQIMDLSFLKDSMQAMQSRPQQSGSIDPKTIHALGQSIANQLARFMNVPSRKSKREGSSKRGTKESRWEYPMLPGDRTARTPSPPPGSSTAALFAQSPNDQDSIWALQRPRRYKPRRTHMRITSAGDGGLDPLQSDPPTHAPASDNDEDDGTMDDRVCYNCSETQSRKWRIGPDGDLCSPCGTYYSRYELMRPLENQVAAPRAERRGPSALGPQRYRLAHGEANEFDIPVTSTPGATGYTANTARRISGDGRGTRFTIEEEELIIKLRDIDRLHWKTIAPLISNRSVFSVQSHHTRLRKRSDYEARLQLLKEDATEKSPVLTEIVSDDPAAYEAIPDDAAPGDAFREDVVQARAVQDDAAQDDGWPDDALSDDVAEDLPVVDHVHRDVQEQKKKSKKPRRSNRHKKSAGEDESNEQSQMSPDENVDASMVRIHPDGRKIRRAKLTDEEKMLLLHLRDEEHLEWEQVAGHFGDRTIRTLKDNIRYIKDNERRVEKEFVHSLWDGPEIDDSVLDDETALDESALDASALNDSGLNGEPELDGEPGLDNETALDGQTLDDSRVLDPPALDDEPALDHEVGITVGFAQAVNVSAADEDEEGTPKVMLDLEAGKPSEDEPELREPVIPQQLRYTPEEDKLIILMRDEESMSFAEMTEYLADTDEEALVHRYTYLKNDKLGSGLAESVSVDVPSRTLARADFASSVREDVRHVSIGSPPDGHDYNGMPPPPRPAPTRMETHAAPTPGPPAHNHAHGALRDIRRYASPSPQTPHVPISPLDFPPPPAEVGPSAWATTQPTSKGPLPFQPARKGIVPIQPRVAQYPADDPFAFQRTSADISLVSRPNRSTYTFKEKARRRRPNVVRKPADLCPMPDEGNIAPPTDVASTTEYCESVNEAAAELSAADGRHQDGGIMTEEESLSRQQSIELQASISIFTPDQDKFIRNAREKLDLGWDEIAKELPGDGRHTAQAITDRYFDVIVATIASKTKVQAHVLKGEPDSMYNVRYTDEESATVRQLKEQGLSWSEMANHLPGRAPVSISNHYYGSIAGTARGRSKSKLQPGESSTKRTRFSAPLLRQALDNSTRRSSNDGLLRPGYTIQKLPRATDSNVADYEDNDSPQMTDGEALETSTTQTPKSQRLPSENTGSEVFSQEDQSCTTEDEDELASPTTIVNATKVQSPHVHSPLLLFQHAVPQSRLEPDCEEHSPETSMLPTAPIESSPPAPSGDSVRSQTDLHENRYTPPDYATVYDTPHRSNIQYMPYFVAPTLGLRVASPDSTSGHGPFVARDALPQSADAPAVHGSLIDQSAADASTLFEDADSSLAFADDELLDPAVHTVRKPLRPETVSSSGTKRKRAPGRSKRVSDHEVADSNSDSPLDEPHEEEDDEGLSGAEVSSNRAKQGSRRFPRSSPVVIIPSRRKSVKKADSGPGDEYRNATAKRSSVLVSRSNIGSGGEPRRNTAKGLASVSYQAMSPVRKGRSFKRPRRAGADADGDATSEPNLDPPHTVPDTPVFADEGVEDHLSDNHSETPGNHDVDPTKLMRPDLNWIDTISAAIRSTPDNCMLSKDIIAWVRENHEYYRHTKKRWAHHIRWNLRGNPIFRRVDPDPVRFARWAFAESNTETATQEGTDVDDGGRDADGEEEATDGLPEHASRFFESVRAAANATESLNISSDSPAKPEPASEGNKKRSRTSPHPTPRSKTLRHSDTALIRRPSTLATPARSGTGRSNLSSRSSKSRRAEPLSGTRVRGSPAFHVGSTKRRIVPTRDAQEYEGSEGQDELY